ncbi:hypothetical protein L1987_76374 [Smallanthus sonchifolius]|uniref:Uncharacterized protein n=1 Tax=Smallanthus sonchifolius TaxID=185202 RepID=A0ACB9A7C9_9ASTR|nr:hypothetical protein L1987_76374 [Smallanthus sonchifolius]
MLAYSHLPELIDLAGGIQTQSASVASALVKHEHRSLWHRYVTPSVSPSVGEGHNICIASSFPVATLGESPEYHPLLFGGSETEPSEESLTSPSPVGYGGLSQVHVMDDTQH